MSRINSYRDNLTKNLNKILINVNPKTKDLICESLKKYNFIIPIITLSTLNIFNKKYKHDIHGYYLALIICLLEVLCLNPTISKDIEIEINNLIDDLISSNSSIIKMNIEKESDVYQYLMSKMNGKQKEIVNPKDFTETINKISYEINGYKKIINNIPKFTFVRNTLHTVNYNFINEEMKTKLKNLKKIQPNEIINYVKESFCSLCRLSIVLSSLIGTDDYDLVKYEKLGKFLGLFIHLGYDFINYETDIEKATLYSDNLIINLGIQKSFELFNKSKEKLVEKCLSNNLYSSTIKDIINNISKNVNEFIERSNVSLGDTISNASSLNKK